MVRKLTKYTFQPSSATVSKLFHYCFSELSYNSNIIISIKSEVN
jgi:hypothetical protein